MCGRFVGNFAVSLPMTIVMVVTGFLFCSVSAYMAGLVGSSNNPVSGITICTILFASLVLMLLMGRSAALGAVADLLSDALHAVSTNSAPAMAAPPKRVNLRVIRLSPCIPSSLLLAFLLAVDIR